MRRYKTAQRNKVASHEVNALFYCSLIAHPPLTDSTANNSTMVTAYQLFVKDNLPRMTGRSGPERMRQVAAAWRELRPEIKNKPRRKTAAKRKAAASRRASSKRTVSRRASSRKPSRRAPSKSPKGAAGRKPRAKRTKKGGRVPSSMTGGAIDGDKLAAVQQAWEQAAQEFKVDHHGSEYDSPFRDLDHEQREYDQCFSSQGFEKFVESLDGYHEQPAPGSRRFGSWVKEAVVDFIKNRDYRS